MKICFRTQTELVNLMHVNDCELKTNILLAEPSVVKYQQGAGHFSVRSGVTKIYTHLIIYIYI